MKKYDKLSPSGKAFPALLCVHCLKRAVEQEGVATLVASEVVSQFLYPEKFTGVCQLYGMPPNRSHSENSQCEMCLTRTTVHQVMAIKLDPLEILALGEV